MGRQWNEITGPITIRDDDGNERQLDVISTFTETSDMHGKAVSESRLKDVRSPDGQTVYSEVEGQFFFGDDPNRIFRIVGDE